MWLTVKNKSTNGSYIGPSMGQGVSQNPQIYFVIWISFDYERGH